MMTRRGRGLFRDDWELIEFPDDYVDHCPAESGWLGFEAQHVVRETQAIRSSWSEEEYRRRAGVNLDLLIPVYGVGGVYGDQRHQKPAWYEAGGRRIEFGRTLTQEKPDDDQEPPQEGA